MDAATLEIALTPVPGDDPSGPDLEYDLEFLQLQETIAGTPERSMGEHTIAARPPEWPKAETLAYALLARSKDIRVLVQLARASLQTGGLAGLADAIGALRGVVTEFWSGAHPRVEDDGDSTLRRNAIASLADPAGLVRELRLAPLLQSRTFGPVSVQSLRIARGHAPAPGGDGAAQAPTPSTIEAAAQQCDADALVASADAMARVVGELDDIDALLRAQLDGTGAGLEALHELATEARDALAGWTAMRNLASSTNVATAAGEAGNDGAVTAQAQASAGVNSREDVVRAIDDICRYYATHEPSSPIPLLLMRAKRLVSKDFLEIIRDISPQALDQIQTISGPPEAPSSGTDDSS